MHFLISYRLGLLLLVAPVLTASAQDSLRVRLEEAEKLFLDKNFVLLAARYNVQATEAAIIQARLYPNPNLFIDQGAYNQQTKKWFDLTKTGQTTVSLQQMILLAGKRSKEINVARINSEVAQFQFFDLVRTLRYELRVSFYSLYFTQQSAKVYDREIDLLTSLIDVYAEQFSKGNIAFKELARLQALQFSLQNERINLLSEALESQRTLSLLIGDTLSRPISPIVNLEQPNAISVSRLTYSQLLDSARTNRFDWLAANEVVKLRQAQFALQKAYRVPDLTLGANYDRAGNYIYNYNSLSLGINLPLWHRNQGNIKLAQHLTGEGVMLKNQKELELQGEVLTAWLQLINSDNLYKSMSTRFNSDYDKLLEGITKGYQERTISLLEFIDYYETYKQSKIEFNHLQNNRIGALENLNLATGSQLF